MFDPLEPARTVPIVRARTSHTVVVEHGLATEVRMYVDVFSFLSQLGLLPVGAAGG